MSRKLNHYVEYLGFTRDVEILLAENYQDHTIIVMSNGTVYRDKALLWATMPGIKKAVIAGKYGNGQERRRRLGSNYAAVQAIVNKRLLG